VPTSNGFYTFIETAYNRGVISGYADGTFRPNANVTRGQLAKMISQGLSSP
jgi:5'-nucleotidase/2',3'-cyclic-nucleotide 2'-phosphodiesterase/3'-nucleotidase/5'-nucleotidase